MIGFLSYVRKLSVAVALLALPAAAQTGLGTVTGTVQDPSKAAVPRASVSLTNTATGIAREAQTNDAGLYSFGSMPVGPYHLKVQAAGFTQWETDFTIQASQIVTVDPQVQMGNVQSKIEVTDAASQIAMQGAQLSDTRTAKEIHDLPLNGRQITNLFTLTPGVEGGQNTQGAAAPRTNGMMVGSTEILLDGMSYVDRFGGGISRVQPGLDTVQEYRIENCWVGRGFRSARNHSARNPQRNQRLSRRPLRNPSRQLRRSSCARHSGWQHAGKAYSQRIRRLRGRPDREEQSLLFL